MFNIYFLPIDYIFHLLSHIIAIKTQNSLDISIVCIQIQFRLQLSKMECGFIKSFLMELEVRFHMQHIISTIIVSMISFRIITVFPALIFSHLHFESDPMASIVIDIPFSTETVSKTIKALLNLKEVDIADFDRMNIILIMIEIESLLNLWFGLSIYTDLVEIEGLSSESVYEIQFTIRIIKRIGAKHFLILQLHIITVSNHCLSFIHFHFHELSRLILQLVVDH